MRIRCPRVPRIVEFCRLCLHETPLRETVGPRHILEARLNGLTCRWDRSLAFRLGSWHLKFPIALLLFFSSSFYFLLFIFFPRSFILKDTTSVKKATLINTHKCQDALGRCPRCLRPPEETSHCGSVGLPSRPGQSDAWEMGLNETLESLFNDKRWKGKELIDR
jgi:hypothetical protein